MVCLSRRDIDCFIERYANEGARVHFVKKNPFLNQARFNVNYQMEMKPSVLSWG